jgi:hypothetical protein
MVEIGVVSSPGVNLYPEQKVWAASLRSLREYDEILVSQPLGVRK